MTFEKKIDGGVWITEPFAGVRNVFMFDWPCRKVQLANAQVVPGSP
jgi:hypothetical protein